MVQFVFGAAMGMLIAVLMVEFMLMQPLERRIETCRQQNNAYECKFQAVPVAAPSWVPQK